MMKCEKMGLQFYILFQLVLMCQSYDMVSNLTYDPMTQICCNEKILDKTSNGSSCCRHQAYNPDTESCCDGVVYPIKEGYECCNKIMYNTETERCVYDYADEAYRVIKANGDKYSSCAGKAFDFSTEFCCKGKVVDNIKNSLACCDNEVIDLKESICCYTENNENIVSKRKSPDDYCYYDIVVNPNTELVCNDVVIPNPDGNLECCGTETFDKSKEFLCCYGANSTKIVSKTNPDHDYCCGDETYSSAKGICCGFGNTAKYHPFVDGKTASYCCGEEIIAYDDEDTSCCNDKIYNYKNQTCCIDYSQLEYVANVYDGADLNCCGAFTYDSDKEDCCGYVTFDPEKQICCGNTLLEKSKDSSCCSYDYDYKPDK